jgi:four helix bundle protein
MFKFEKLDVWQEAIAYADAVYDVTELFPKNEQYGLTSQLTRSAVSVSGNIAEGSGRTSPADFGRFVEIAYGSLMETVSHLTIARRRRYVSEEAYQNLYQQAERQARMLSGLRQTLRPPNQ